MILRLAFALVLAPTLTWPVQAQRSHVQLAYDQEADKTVVTSDLLYVINMPSQFMQVQLTGRYSRQGKTEELPDRINIEFFSYAPAALYQVDAAHRLKIKADEQVFDFGLLSYSKIDEKYKTTADQTRTHAGVRAGLPATALVGANKKVPLAVELMTIGVTLADLNALARAQSTVIKIGETVFPLTATHMMILREFVQALTPTNGEISRANIVKTPVIAPPDVPSEENHAPLDETLKWIKTQIEREGSTKDPVVARKLEPLDFKTCRVRYRVVPLFRTSPVSSSLVYAIMEYQVNLSDLNAETVWVAKYSEYATVFVRTRDVERKIKVIKHENYNGTTGRTLDETTASAATMNLKTAEAANRLKFALVHAINLCQAQTQK